MNIVVGTAGHIDHGKTALIKALTGVDADRLPEEKLRGITIDIGFAELALGNLNIGFVDVPGHEKFVKNMLAGASGIDLVLLVIATNEGVMPQTREHFEICRLLGIKSGLVIITKSDLADEELVELVKLETAELVKNSFLENAPMIPVSARTGAGMGELKRELTQAASRVSIRNDEFVTRLPIDRSFTVKGFGTVVTGTLASGEISRSDELELLPIGRRVRVRGLQTHGQEAIVVCAGMRTAVNLGGIDHAEIDRGMVLSEKGILRPTQILDAQIEVLKDAKRPVKSRQRVRVHIGTTEALARVSVLNDNGEICQGKQDFVQIRLEVPVAAVPGERLIIRSYSPQMTIGGGRILDALPPKHRKKDIENATQFLQSIAEASDSSASVRLFVDAADEAAINFSELQARTGLRKEILQKAIDKNLVDESIVMAGGFYASKSRFKVMKAQMLAEIKDHHARQPLSSGILRETLREHFFTYIPEEVFRAAIMALVNEGKIVAEKDIIRAVGHSLELSPEETTVRDRLAAIYNNAGFVVPTLDDALAEAVLDNEFGRDQARKIFQLLVNSTALVKVSEEFYFGKAAIDGLRTKMREFASAKADRLIDVPKFKEIAGISRKYAIPLLEYFDREKVTVRVGDKRLIL